MTNNKDTSAHTTHRMIVHFILPRMHSLPDTEQLRGVSGEEWLKLDLEPRYEMAEP